MTGFFLTTEDANKARADLFEQRARGVVADHWEQQARAQLPDLIQRARTPEQVQVAPQIVSPPAAAPTPNPAAQQFSDQASRVQIANDWAAQARKSIPDMLTQVQTSPTAAPPMATGVDSGAPPPAVAAMTSPSLPPPVASPAPIPTPEPIATPPPTPVQTINPPPVQTTNPAPTGDWTAQARAAATAANIDPDIFTRQIQQESGGDPNAQSPAGARGIAQFMPETAAGLGINPDDPGQALPAAARLMRSYLDKYGGDMAKALAAYNAGPGNVDKYGGVPPFDETKAYVSKILGSGAAQAVAAAVPGGSAVLSAAQQGVNQTGRTSQFGLGYSAADAYAACGPAAAIAFAQRYGRNPTPDEALQLAKQVGWTPDQGMAGVQSEQALLNKMGISSKLEQGVNWQHVQSDVSSGNPVIIDTPGHYFYVDQYDPQRGYHVGTSGTDLKQGSEWMSPAQMAATMGAPRAALYADNPQGGPSIAQGAQSAFEAGANVAKAIIPGAGQVANAAQNLTDFLSKLGHEPTDQELSQKLASDQLMRAGPGGLPVQSSGSPAAGLPSQPSDLPFGGKTAADLLTDPLKAAYSSDIRQQLAPNITEPNHPFNVMQEMQDKYGTGAGLVDQSRMTPEDRQRYQNAMMTVGGVEGASMPSAPTVSAAGAAVVPELKPPVPVPGAEPIVSSAADEVARLRLDKFPTDVRDTIQAAAESTNFAQVQRRGVIPDAVAEQMANRYAADTTLNQLIKSSPAGTAFNTEEIRAIRNATASQALKLNDAAAAITAGDKSPQALSDFFTEGQRLQRLVTVAEGARAEAGRSLRAFGGDVNAVPLDSVDAVTRLTKLYGGDQQKLFDMVQQYQALVNQGAGPIQMANYWARATKPPVSAFDWFKALRYNSMISGVPTVGRITATSTLENIYGLGREMVLNPRGISDEAAGAAAGFARGGSSFWETLANGITEEQAAQGGLPRGISARLENPVAQGAATALEMPGRVHQAVQDVSQQTSYSMKLYSLANQMAKGDPEKMAAIVANPTDDMVKTAMAYSQRAGMRGDMGTVGSWMNKMPEPLRNLLMPFLRVAYNIQTRGIDRSPIGAIGTAIDVARTGGKYVGANTQGEVEALGLGKAVRPFAERAFDNVVGTLITGGAYEFATQGKITGAGPTNPRERDQLSAQGWQPFSLKVGDHYVPYAFLGPWATPLALGAAVAEAGTYKSAAKPDASAMFDAMRRSGELLTNESYLRDLGDAYKMIQEPERYAPRLAADYAGSVIPYGALINNVASATDARPRQPMAKDVMGTIGQGVAERIPGLREGLPERTGPLGESLPNTRGGVAGFAPTAPSQAANDPIYQFLGSHGVTLPSAPKTITRGAGIPIPLTPEEQQRYEEIRGQRIQQYVGQWITRPEVQAASPQAQTTTLQRMIRMQNEAATNLLEHEIGADELRRRELEQGKPPPRRPLPAITP